MKIHSTVGSVINSMRDESKRKSKKTADDKFIVSIPEIAAYVGIAGLFVITLMLIWWILTSREEIHYVIYICLGPMTLLYMYLILKTVNFKVIVKKDLINVRTILRRKYSFTFAEIVSAKRQTKNNRVKSERIVIKTSSGKKLIVENSFVGYKRFFRRVISDVDASKLNGFD